MSVLGHIIPYRVYSTFGKTNYTRTGAIMKIGEFVKAQRKKQHWTQKDLAFYGGVGLRFVRDLEQGKSTLRMDKVNQILGMFSAELAVAPVDRSIYA